MVNTNAIILGVLALFVVGAMTGYVDLGGVDSEEKLRECVIESKDCDYVGIVNSISGTLLLGVEEASCSDSELAVVLDEVDRDDDCQVSDEEHQDALDLYIDGVLSNFCFLEVNQVWGNDSLSLRSCGSGETTTTLCSVTCSDTDSGMDLMEKGSISGTLTDCSTYTQEDYCYENKIRERYCSGDRRRGTFTFCPEGYSCANGECIFTGTTISTSTSTSTVTPTTTTSTTTTTISGNGGDEIPFNILILGAVVIVAMAIYLRGR